MSEPSFETSLNRLEKIVTQLEGGKLSLEESVKTFEEGMKLALSCQKLISEAEKKIEILTKGEDGLPHREPFKEEEEG
ncbi:MAG: exodeoxyribonuclease VII small subunit [Deltaproteobacteria bacterium RIFCSPHIGHO2_12_FULL_43_9]|nr:MAG: exodeoxyribonuclease VII small subunit [Deltaproteobacteria bacterium RIFCSPHIGHO2_12_FULL_43_9]